MTSTTELRHVLSGTQMSLIVMGGAIGTGLFLGSGFATGLAGPSVLISFAIGAVVALLLMSCLAEMTIVHPRDGGFGVLASRYIGPLAGVLVSYAYLSANLLAIGTEATAVALCMTQWVPNVGAWFWVSCSALCLLAINGSTVRAFGAIESAFSIIKIAAIIVFIGLGTLFIFRAPAGSHVGLENFHTAGGFFPRGLSGTWMAVVVALFSYMSVELIAITAAEAQDPRPAIVKALRLTCVRLTLFYLITVAVILAVQPWNEIGSRVSSFVTVMRAAGLPAAADLLNAVVLVAALSSMNSQLYGASRTVLTLVAEGDAPSWLGLVNGRGVPMRALALAAAGMVVAIIVNALFPDTALQVMIALSVFGALFTWLTIFVSHIGFRRRVDPSALPFRMVGYPYTSFAGFFLVAGVMITTLFMPAFRLSLACGVPFLILVAFTHLRRRKIGRLAG